MCANYVPVTSAQRMLDFFGIEGYEDQPLAEVWPSGMAPFIRLSTPDGSGRRVRLAEHGIFRFVPSFAVDLEWAKHTYNLRSERVHIARNFGEAWRAGQRCIIPAEAFFENNHESGEAVRWRIRHASGEPMGIAGVYRSWTMPNGEIVFSMGMLTVNADDHPVMKQFHAPDDEKRMVVILDPQDFEAWLTCPVEDAQDLYCKQWNGPLSTEPAPVFRSIRKKPPPQPKPPKTVHREADLLGPAEDIPVPPPPPRGPKAPRKPKAPPPPPPPIDDLFG